MSLQNLPSVSLTLTTSLSTNHYRLSDGVFHQHPEEADPALPGPPGHVRVLLPGRYRPPHDRPQLPADDPPLPQKMFQHHWYVQLFLSV